MGEILSHAEVEAILSAIEPSRPVTRPQAMPEKGSGWEEHDFCRAEPLQGTALQVVHALHEGICQRWQQRLESVLQSPVEVRAVGACQSSTTEFLSTLSSPCVVCEIAHAKSAALSSLVWSADLVQMLIARMLGDTEGGAGMPVHVMTNIERRLLGRLNDAVLGELDTLLRDQLQIKSIFESPKKTGPGTGFSNIWFSFEVATGRAAGLIHVGVPAFSMSPPEPNPAIHVEAIPAGLRQVSVQVSANLALLKIKTSDLASLEVGDLVMTDLSSSQAVSLQLDGQDLCEATIGTHLGRKALRLTKPVQK